MKKLALSLAMVTLALTGCASKVITYDANGQVIGSCVSTSGFVLGAHASCTGTANQEGKK